MRDPYSVLGVKRDAGQDEIKAAWRTKAKTAHPDQNRDDPGATSRFAEIGHAYDILKDPKKRSRYDERVKRAETRGGPATYQEQREAARQAAERAKTARANAEKVMEELLKAEAAKAKTQKTAGAGTETPEEVISRIFGVKPEPKPASGQNGAATSSASASASASSAAGPEASERTTAAAAADEDVEMTENGARVPSSISAQAIDLLASFMRRIRGGQAQPDKAPDVTTVATVGVDDLMKLNWVTVPLPDGKDGRFQIEPGAADGDVVRLRGQGLKLQGMQRGDVIVTLRVDQTGPFRVQGSDVHTILPVNLQNAVLGWVTMADSPTGPVEVTVPEWTGSDHVIRIAGRGLPKADGGKGDLVVEIRLVLWEKPDAKVTDLMRAMREGLYL